MIKWAQMGERPLCLLLYKERGISVKITRLKVNHLECPMGYDFSHVTLSYTVEACRGQFAKEMRIQVSYEESAENCLLDTGLVACAQEADTGRVLSGIDNLHYELELALRPRTRYYWRAFVRTDAQEEAWSEWSWLETAKQDEAWAAEAIGSPLGAEVHPVFHKHFYVDDGLAAARMYILGLGMYEAYLNGEKLGQEVLSPGFHTYDSELQYQTLELKPRPGDNLLTVMLGDGWYKGRYGLKASAPRYGTDYALIAEIHLHYGDGDRKSVV